jgi:predicted dinucleotide-binding enzyme
MKIGIIGAGEIGGTLTRRLTQLRNQVFVANAHGPSSLAALAKETGAKPVSVREAATAGEVVIVTIPEAKIRDLPKNLFKGVPPDVVVIDTGNYYPLQRDGRIDEIENGMTESRWVATQLGRPVVKAFNTMNYKKLLEQGRPQGPGRLALPVAGDDPRAKQVVLRMINELGFDGVDAGSLDDSWRQQPGTPVYDKSFDSAGVRRTLAEAHRERLPQWRASGNLAESA